MKKFFISLLLAGVSLTSLAQTTREVTGAVIDKNGNPLPGAKIEATGGAESTVTDADGTFHIEVSRWLKSLTATYPGMSKKKMKLGYQNEMLFEMKPAGKLQWFVNIQGQYDIEYANGGVGVLFGQLGKWGWYARILQDVVAYDGHAGVGAPAVSVGLIKRIIPNLFGYTGLGYGTGYERHYYSYNYHYSTEPAANVDLGLIACFKHICLNLGLSLRAGPEPEIGFGINLGVGYAF